MRYKKKKVRIKWGRFLACILILCIIVAALVFVPKLFKKPSGNTANNTNNTSNSNTANTANTNNTTPAKKTEVSVKIRMAGDILYHNPVIDSGKQADGSYDYADQYALVKKWLGDADLTLVQFETTFNVDETPRVYQGGYPTLVFDSPDILAKNVKDTGVDVAVFANNHMLDSRLPGTKTTVKYLRELGYTAVSGARADTSEPRSQIVEAAGLKIGIVAFTYETDLSDKGKRTVNGTPMEDDAPDYINSFRYEEGADGLYHINTDDLALIKSEMDWCRNQGAEILICYFHRGRGAQEYASQPDNPDKELMQFAAENGADIIFAGHPHVLQPIDVINVDVPYPDGVTGDNKSAKWTKTVPVYYSMGNFISNQRYETLNGYAPVAGDRARLTEQGIIANVELTYVKETGEIKYTDISAIPTWVDKYNNGSRDVFQIIPLLENLDSVACLQASGHTQRAKDALNSITEFLGEKYIYKTH